MNFKKKYIIGTSGWNYDHWEGRFYPSSLPKKEWFNFYAKNFESVEINYSFYRWPSRESVKRWYRDSPKNFKFTLKAPRTITHVKKLQDTKKWVGEFYKLASLLKEKLACLLFQLPPSFKFNEKNFLKLEEFLKSLDKKLKNVIEFRDREWWNEKVYNLLRKYKITFCIVSGLEMPRDLVITNEIAYLRFHGINYSSNYSDKVLKEYAEKIKKLECKEVYAYFNNDTNAYAVFNAKSLKKFLSSRKTSSVSKKIC